MNTWIDSALNAASDLPGAGAGCIIIIDDTTQANLRWANNALTTNGQMHSRTASVVALANVEGGVASGCIDGPVTSADEVIELVKKAADLAASASPDDDAAELVDGGVDDDFTAEPEATSIEVFANIAAGLGRAFEAGADKYLLFGFAEHTVTTRLLGTSTGTRRRAVTNIGRLELNAKNPDMIGSAWVGRASADFSDVDIDECIAEVLERLSWCDNRIELPAGRYETLIPAGAVADLMIYAYWMMSGRDAREGSTVYSGKDGTTRVGEKLATLPITVASDPAEPGIELPTFAATGSSTAGLQSVFDNGRKVSRVDWLKDGVLENLVETSGELAKTDRAGQDITWPTENLVIDAGSNASLKEMIASTKRGLLLTCMWYIREVDPEKLLLTGLTRDGVYLVEDGQITGMVNNFRWNESPIDLLKRATEASATEKVLCREWNDWFTLTKSPALRVPDFNMSTVSKAY